MPPAHYKPLPPRKKRPFRKSEDGLSFLFPAKGLSVCTPSLADGQKFSAVLNLKPEKKGKTMTTPDRIPYPTKFPLGQIVATQGALAACDPHHLQGGITAYPIPASLLSS